MNERHRAFIDKYINFAEPFRMPCLLGEWTDTTDQIVTKSKVLGCQAQRVDKPQQAIEIIGRKTRFLVRDYGMVNTNDKPRKDIRLYDQFCIFELESVDDANEFVDLLQQKILSYGHDITLTATNPDKIPQRQRHFVCSSTIAGYGKTALIFVSYIHNRFYAENENAVDLLIHWKLNVYD